MNNHIQCQNMSPSSAFELEKHHLSFIMQHTFQQQQIANLKNQVLNTFKSARIKMNELEKSAVSLFDELQNVTNSKRYIFLSFSDVCSSDKLFDYA